jgi:SAM-dependent methyltransferase
MPHFDKYDEMQAYHWDECNRFSRFYNPPLVARYKMIVRRVVGGRVLDIGSGDGYLGSLLAPKCESVICLEYEKSGVHAAKSKLSEVPNIRVVQGSAYALPFPDHSFDVVVLADVIEHLEDPDLVILEIARVLKATGTIYVSTPKKCAGQLWDDRHITEFSPEELCDILLLRFSSVSIHYGWSKRWFDIYRTRLGWRALKWAGRLGFNPFSFEGLDPDNFYQLLAIAKQPRVCRSN